MVFERTRGIWSRFCIRFLHFCAEAKAFLIDNKLNRNILVAIVLVAMTALIVWIIMGDNKHVLSDGSIYVGEWDEKNECPDGVGYLVTIDENGVRDTIRGFFEEGNLVEAYNQKNFKGLVVAASYNKGENSYQARTYASGERYLGFFRNGKRNGDLGLCIKPDGSMQFGRWVNDSCRSNPPFRIEEHVYGIDVSHFQKLNWDELCFQADSAGNVLINRLYRGYEVMPVLFVMTKASEGTDNVDETFKNFYNEASRHRIIRGTYHVLSMKSQVSTQVANYLNTVDTFRVADLPPILDVEATGDGLNGQRIDSALVWLRMVEEITHHIPILYMSENLYRLQILKKGRKYEFERYPLWIANYSREPAEDINWTFWQFTYTGFVNGLNNGKPGMDIDKFNGNYRQLEDFIRTYGFMEKWPE